MELLLVLGAIIVSVVSKLGGSSTDDVAANTREQIMRYLFSLEDCFLAKKKWQAVMTGEAGNNATTAVGREGVAMLDQYFVHLARVPAVIRCGYIIRETRKHGMPIDAAQVAFIKQQGARLREDFLAWFERHTPLLQQPLEIPSEDPSSPYETVLRFENNWYGSVTMGYWASMLIIQECLNQAASDEELYAESNRKLARNIYRSFETVGSGLMGPYRVGYAMRISYDFADMPRQVWIHSLLGRMEQRYASTRSEVYPPPSSNSYNYN